MRIAPPVAAMAMLGLALASLVALTRQGPEWMPAQPGGVAIPVPAQHPVPEMPVRGLPDAGRSDAALRSALARIPGGDGLAQLLAPRDVVSRIAAAVEGVTRSGITREGLPLVTPGGFPLAHRTPLSQRHFARYEPYVRALESADLRAMASLYLRMYPLFDAAWKARAPGARPFNDAVVAAIDHLLEAPELEAPPMLVRRDAFMAFEDPALERRSAGHKLMLRMGESNARRVKAVLADARRRIATGATPD